MVTPHASIIRIVLPLTGVVLYACGGEDVTAPATMGTLQVTTITDGVERDTDGYSIQIDAGPATTIGSGQTRTFAEVMSGDRTVQLSGLAPNCGVAEENPRTVNVLGGAIARITFTVTCAPTTGRLRVSAASSGPDLDPDGYVISVDGIEHGSLGTNATVIIRGLAPGNHEVGLSGLAANCQIENENIRSVAVTAGAESEVAFTITCAPRPPGAGDLRISTATSGADVDPDGYVYELDRNPGAMIGVTTTITIQNVAPGEHSVLLYGLSRNCSVEGADPKSAIVTDGGVVELNFEISCRAITGTINVTVATLGSSIDPDGYLVELDGNPGTPVSSNGTVSLSGLEPGVHVIGFSGLAANCGADAASRNVTVTAGVAANVSLAVTCGPDTGSILVTSATSGAGLDPNGYFLSLDGASPGSMTTNGVIRLGSVPAGDHSVELAGVASNCTVVGGSRRIVAVTAGAQASVDFPVTCNTSGEIRWTLIPFPTGFAGPGMWASAATDIYVAGSSANGGAILHYDGQNWTSQFLPDNAYPFAVWGSGPNDVYAAGTRFVWHNTGNGWVRAHDTGQWDELTLLGGSSPQNVFAAGFRNTQSNKGLMLTYNGWWTEEELISEMGTMNDVSGLTPTDGWAVAEQLAPYSTFPGELYGVQTVWHFDGRTWSNKWGMGTLHGEPTDQLLGIWPVASNDVFTVGTNGRIFRYDGSNWMKMTSPTLGNLHDVWGTSGSDVFAVGTGGILRYDGSSWTVIDQRKGTRVWGSGTDVFVLTEGGVLHGTR